MKTLKLDHEQAQLILNGKKSTTWRLYDDKDLSVNDVVQLIDKVSPNDPTTWGAIGMAQITKIVQKPIGDVARREYGEEGFSSRQEMLETYGRRYTRQISSDTPLKIIHFSFTPEAATDAKSDLNKTTKMLREIKLYADGGSRGNPGPSATGFVILDMNDRIVVKKGVYLGITTNNQAEYQAVKMALEEARKLQAQIVHVYLDSLLIVNQMAGIFRVKNRDLWPIHAAIKGLVRDFKKVSFTHVPRELNKLADGAVNEALDRALKKN